MGFRLLIVFLLMMVGIGTISAQYHRKKFNYYTIGVKLGPDFINYKIDPNKNFSDIPKLNFSVGVSGGYYYYWLLEFHGALLYSSRNWYLDWTLSENPEAIDETKYVLQYISLPLEARYNVLYLNEWKVSVGTGIFFDFRLKPKEYKFYNDGSFQESVKYWNSKNFTKILVGLPLTLNIKFYLDRHNTIELGGAYNLYFNRMHKDYLLKPGSSYTARLAFYYEW
jgi:hypothetical protein